MKRIIFAVVCVLFSGYAYAVVAHPENPDIVGRALFGDSLCLNNDGTVIDALDCDGTATDEGWLHVVSGNWLGGTASGIKGCGTSAVSPVSSATCPFTHTSFASCLNNEYVLFQTTKSGHFWAIKANSDCSGIATPETTGLEPCRKNDNFDPVLGCTPTGNPPQIRVESGYIKLEVSSGSPPPISHCGNGTHRGRMVVDDVNNLLYICTQSGWITK